MDIYTYAPKLGRALLIAGVLCSFLVAAPFSYAQEPTPSGEASPVSGVATESSMDIDVRVPQITVSEVLLTEQETGALQIIFTATSDALQEGVRYGAALYRPGVPSEVRRPIDIAPSEETLALHPGSPLTRAFTYVPPQNLQGEYEIVLDVRTKTGIPIAEYLVGVHSFAGSANASSSGLSVQSCNLAAVAATGVAYCMVTNPHEEEIVTPMSLSIREGGVFGPLVASATTEVRIAPGALMQVTFEALETEDLQSGTYGVEVLHTDTLGTVLSRHAFEEVVRVNGAPALQISNIFLKEDVLSVSVSSPRPDMTLVVTPGSSESGCETATVAVVYPRTDVSLPECAGEVLSVEYRTQDGTVFDTELITVPGEASVFDMGIVSGGDQTYVYMGVLILSLLVLLIIFSRLGRRHKVVMVLALCFFFGNGADASASASKTYACNPNYQGGGPECSDDNITVYGQVVLNKTTFQPGEVITGSISLWANPGDAFPYQSANLYIGGDCRQDGCPDNNIFLPAFSGFVNFALGPYERSFTLNSGSFTAPSTPGTYTISYAVGWSGSDGVSYNATWSYGSVDITVVAPSGVCTGSVPSGAASWDSEEETGLSSNVGWSHASSDTATKCQYRCTVGTWNGTSCSTGGGTQYYQCGGSSCQACGGGGQPACTGTTYTTSNCNNMCIGGGGTYSISASPNPVQICAPATQGATTINWAAPSGSNVNVHVNGNLFASTGGGNNSGNAPWIQSGQSYTFVLTTAADGVERGRVTVTTTSAGCGGGGFCGNGVVNAGEACDDGASNGTCPAFCSSSCTVNSCYVPNPSITLTLNPTTAQASGGGAYTNASWTAVDYYTNNCRLYYATSHSGPWTDLSGFNRPPNSSHSNIWQVLGTGLYEVRCGSGMFPLTSNRATFTVNPAPSNPTVSVTPLTSETITLGQSVTYQVTVTDQDRTATPLNFDYGLQSGLWNWEGGGGASVNGSVSRAASYGGGTTYSYNITITPSTASTYKIRGASADGGNWFYSGQRTITVTNPPPANHTIMIRKAGLGNGSVNYEAYDSSWGLIEMGTCSTFPCSRTYPTGAYIFLDGTASGGSTFTGFTRTNASGPLGCTATYPGGCEIYPLNAAHDVTATFNATAPSCVSTGNSGGTSATSGTYRVYAYGVTGATSVSFPTWGDPGGQDDVVWYPGTNAGSGTWYADINLANHKVGNPELGTFNVHVYLNNAAYSNVFCGTANFTRSAASTNPPTVMIFRDSPATSGITLGQSLTYSPMAWDDGDLTRLNFDFKGPEPDATWNFESGSDNDQGSATVLSKSPTDGWGDSFSTTITPTAAGTYTVRAAGLDNGGARWTHSVTQTFTVCAPATPWNGSACAAPSQPDLIPSGLNKPGTATVGTAFTANAGPYNQGTASSGNFQTTFTYQWNSTSGAWLGPVNKMRGPLAPSTVVPMDDTYTFTPTQTGNLYLRYCLDTSNLNVESDETNNCMISSAIVVSPAPQPNLTVTNPAINANPGFSDPTTVTFSGTARNTGTGATPVATNFWADVEVIWNQSNCAALSTTVPASHPNLATKTAGGAWTNVAAGWTAPVSATFNASAAELQNGTHCYRLVIDRGLFITESSEADNATSWQSFTISSLLRCENGIDDDGDGTTDSADSDCNPSNPPCPNCNGEGAQCTGANPANATLCSGDSTGLSGDTAKTVVTACSNPAGSAPKCEFRCDAGYVAVSGRCIQGTISASPNPIQSGGTTVVTWSTTNTSGLTCTVNGGGSNWTGTSGSQTSNTLSAPTTYALGCNGVALAQTTVNLFDPPTLTASPRIVDPGGVSTLDWNLNGNTSCTLTGGGLNIAIDGSIPANQTGSQNTPAIFGTTTFRITCGTAVGTVTVEVRETGHET